MTAASLTIHPATDDDLDHVAALLAANELPFKDIRESPARFFLARVDGKRVGVGGLETYGAEGLLRSLVIAADYRGRGYGTALRESLEAEARERGVTTLYLLTTTAGAFFARNGYEEINRAVVPASVQETREFRDLCPESAVPMRKRLR